MIVKYTYNNLFWNVNDNVPSTKSFNLFKAKMLDNSKEPVLRINFITFNDLEIVSKSRDIKYIWVNYLEKNYYYLVKGISKILKGGYLLKIELDIYTTFTLPFVDRLLLNNQEIEILRSHKFDDKSSQFNDEKFENAFIEYQNIDGKIIEHSSQKIEEDIYYYNNYLSIKNPDFNANQYYVFKAGKNESYVFLPLINENNPSLIASKEKKPVGEKELTYSFIAYTNSISNGTVISTGDTLSPTNFNNEIKNLYKENKYIYYSNPCINEYYNEFGVLPTNFTIKSSINVNHSTYNNFYTYWVVVDLYCNDIKLGGVSTKSTGYGTYNDGYQLAQSVVNFYSKINIYVENTTETVDWTEYKEYANYFNELEALKLSQEYSNKFLGIYFLPNILSFGKNYNIIELTYTPNGETSRTSKFLNGAISSQGITIDYFNIFEWNFDNRWWLFNNTNYNSKNILSFVGINYFNNKINVGLRADTIYIGQNITKLGGYLYFSSNGNLIAKTPNLTLQNSIITFPYQLPSGTNEYINYVNATKNSVDTSYNITKQNAIKEGVFGTLSGGASMLKGGVQLGMGNATGVANLLQGGIGIISSITSSMLAVKQKEETIRAKYKDKNNQLGNQLAESNTLDAMWKVYNKTTSQGEIIEYKNLTDSSLKSLNNVITLYGEFYPRIENIKNVWDVEGSDIAGYRYIQFAEVYLENIYYKYKEDIPFEYKEIIIKMLSDGLRFWDLENPFFEDYTTPPEQPEDNPNDNQPIIPEEPIKNEITIEIQDFPTLHPTFTKIATGWTQIDINTFLESFLVIVQDGRVSIFMNNGSSPSGAAISYSFTVSSFPDTIIIDCKNKDMYFPYKNDSNFNFCIIESKNNNDEIYKNFKNIKFINVSETSLNLIKSVNWKSTISYYNSQDGKLSDNFKINVYINGVKYETN